MLFGKKNCPACGHKMKICTTKIPLTAEEKKELEYFAEVSGEPIALNGKIRGFNSEMCLKCNNCGLILNSLQYSKARAEQKRIKKTVLTSDRLKELLSSKIENKH